MGVETDADLAGFFNPREFGTRLSLDGAEFHAIDTTGAVSLDPAGIAAGISQTVPRLICRKDDVPVIQQGDMIEFLEMSPHNVAGTLVTVNDLQFKGSLVIVHYHTGF